MARRAIRMPKMSMTMTEGEVSSWTVPVGAEIKAGDVVCEVLTDKVDMEVETTVSGTLVEIVHGSGVVEVGEPIGWVESDDTDDLLGNLFDESGGNAPTEAGSLSAEPPPELRGPELPADGPADGPIPAVPRARALARERGLDLELLVGSGPDGLVTVSDVEAAISPPPARPTAVGEPPREAVGRAPASGDRRTAVRRVVARTMTPSAAIPQFTVWRELHLDAAESMRAGLSWTTVLLRAYAAALRSVPELLSRWEDDSPTKPGVPSVALAVATERGLLVPTFVEPDSGDAAETDAEVRAVIQAAQSGKVDQAHMAVANASLSNLGGLGVDRFQALLTPPQASVLSLGSIRRRPVAVPGGLGLAMTVEAGLTVDHRVADGAHAANLLAEMARLLG